jgi:hypothetical protein
VKPGVSYNVRVYVGDASFARNLIQVSVEGAAPYTIPFLAAGSFDSRLTLGAVSADDRLTIGIADLSGPLDDPFWVINGIEILEVGPDSGPLAPRGQSAGTSTSDWKLLQTGLVDGVWYFDPALVGTAVNPKPAGAGGHPTASARVVPPGLYNGVVLGSSTPEGDIGAAWLGTPAARVLPLTDELAMVLIPELVDELFAQLKQ